jgi:hypothetical protein
MGARRKRRRREELEEEQQLLEPATEQKEAPAATPAAPADRALELQKTAGNRAVGAALSRWGLPWIPVTRAPQWPKEAEIIVDGTVIPLSSWSWADRGAGAGAGGTGRGKAAFNEIVVSTVLGEHSTDLALSTAQGRPIKTVILVVPGKDGKGITITLTDVLISSYQISGNQESWSLSFAGKELSQSPPPAQP